jgi:hypothetical protein
MISDSMVRHVFKVSQHKNFMNKNIQIYSLTFMAFKKFQLKVFDTSNNLFVCKYFFFSFLE